MMSGVVHYFEDVIVLLVDTGVELLDMLDVVQDYVVKWKMKFIGKKSKVMVARKGGCLKWNIDGEELEVMEAFRYLGVWLMKNYEGMSTYRKLR